MMMILVAFARARGWRACARACARERGIVRGGVCVRVCASVCVCYDAEMHVVDDVRFVVAISNERGGGGGLSVALDDANPIMILNSRRVCGVYR